MFGRRAGPRFEACQDVDEAAARIKEKAKGPYCACIAMSSDWKQPVKIQGSKLTCSPGQGCSPANNDEEASEHPSESPKCSAGNLFKHERGRQVTWHLSINLLELERCAADFTFLCCPVVDSEPIEQTDFMHGPNAPFALALCPP